MPHRAKWLLVISMLACLPIPVAARTPDQSKPAYPSEVSITVEGDYRIIKSNGIPNHPTGQFPGAGNPNKISPQKYEYRVPANPKVAATPTFKRMQSFGIAVNGVPFDPGAAEWWNGDHDWQYEPLTLAPLYLGTDGSHAHVQPTGAYHYHGIPTALIQKLTGGQSKTVLVGWAADGFPMYNLVGLSNPNDAKSALKKLKSSYRVKKGTRPSGPGGAYDGTFVADYECVAGSGDLDECNGRVAITPEYPQGIYHYVLTEEFPFIPRLHRGTSDNSFSRGGPGGGPGGAGRRNGPNGGGGNGGGAGSGGGFTPGFHLIPIFAANQLNLTPDEQTQVTVLEKEIRDQLAKILTPEQMKALEESRPPGLGRGGPGGGSGGPPGGPGQQ